MLLVLPQAPSVVVQGVALESNETAPVAEARPLGLRLTGWPARSRMTLVVTRRLAKWVPGEGGAYKQERIRMVGWTAVRVGADGTADLDRVAPLAGSAMRTGSATSFWSAYPENDPAVPKDLPTSDDAGLAENEARLTAVSDAGGTFGATIRFRTPDGVRIVAVTTPTLNAVYAYPHGTRRSRGLITLHGSEGGSAASALSRATMFAARGIPTLGVNYFAWPRENVPNLAQSNLNTPVELLETARAYLAARPEVDARRIGIYGVSKGAEFSLVGAATYPWIKAIVAVVPSDSVWEGYPTPKRVGRESTWSLRGQPLPYIPLYDVEPGRYRVNTDRYERSRLDRPKEAAAALIPIERTRARLLLLAGDRDEVWASGRMARSVAGRMARFGKARQVEVSIEPLAGHQISGAGLFPVRLYGVQGTDPRDKSLEAEGAAVVSGWERTVAFLNRNL